MFYCVVSNSLYWRVCLLIFDDQIFVDYVSFLSMITYEVLYTELVKNHDFKKGSRDRSLL